ncbi:hypothetical protein NDI56_14060 [Haloarcula sp. S1CR25-12]|uniref:Uncharacterized protein n=1 Tax=Haloarcula saliterrae TaxID=2950534 RepID=A0ABU2FFL3_9EURY|nr:hypothetical protein [Haloarcula sp. S1CR25-12]MDS0260526.1 hypothetical protein [Haloarcula sp. S1CR25-12]
MLLAVAVLSLAVGSTAPSEAHPPNETDHGVNESTFWTLWAGDNDSRDLSETNTMESLKLLTDGTDVPLDRPPRAVETWNTGEHSEVPQTGTDAATHPQDTTLSDGAYLQDVGISMVALQPSTRAHLSERVQPLYIAPEGEAHGVIDYRIDVPETRSSGSRTIQWDLRSHEVASVRLRLDGEVLDETRRDTTPTLRYTDLEVGSDSERQLTLEATVSTTLRRTVITEEDTCTDTQTNGTAQNTTEDCRTVRSSSSTLHDDSVTVRDTRQVRIYAFVVSGFKTEYPDGDLGLVTYKSHPWYGVSLPNGEVRGVWRFYSARNPAWDTLTTYRSDGSTTAHSPVHPLQVHAYPIATGPTPWPRATTSLLDVYGETQQAPSLPAQVELDAIEGRYTGSFGIATRAETTNHNLSQMEIIGLVRGTNRSLDPEKFSSVPLSESNLTLEIADRTDERLSVRARLSANDTGEPIETASREGYLVVAGETVETNESGIASVTFSRSEDAVSARYVPGYWWRNVPGYTGDTAVIHTGGTVLQYVDALFRGFVPVAALLLGGYIISRLTSWHFWPPWRGL